jgi:hypothetical protein
VNVLTGCINKNPEKKYFFVLKFGVSFNDYFDRHCVYSCVIVVRYLMVVFSHGFTRSLTCLFKVNGYLDAGNCHRHWNFLVWKLLGYPEIYDKRDMAENVQKQAFFLFPPTPAYLIRDLPPNRCY